MAHPEIDYSVFVGDLAYEVDDALLEQTFRTYYPSTKQAKVMLDSATSKSRGFGFVRFTVEAERDRAINEMNGVYIGNKPIRVSLATRKPPGGAGTGGPSTPNALGHTGTVMLPMTAAPAAAQPMMVMVGAPGGPQTAGSTGGTSSAASTATAVGKDADPAMNPSNTTLFVGGLSSSVSEAELHAVFARCGEIVYTKIPPGKGCGFVQFVTRPAAEYALESLNGYVLGGMPIRISWGKSSRPPGGGGGGPHHPSSVPPAAHAAGYPPAGYAYPSYDPYYGSYGMPGYDPYAGYAGYGVDPYTGYPGYMHPAHAHGPAGVAAAAAASAAAAQHGGPPPGTPGAIQPMLYDPLAPPSVDKMNMAYMHRHVPVLTGAYVRVPIAAMPMNPQPM